MPRHGRMNLELMLPKTRYLLWPRVRADVPSGCVVRVLKLPSPPRAGECTLALRMEVDSGSVAPAHGWMNPRDRSKRRQAQCCPRSGRMYHIALVCYWVQIQLPPTRADEPTRSATITRKIELPSDTGGCAGECRVEQEQEDVPPRHRRMHQ